MKKILSIFILAFLSVTTIEAATFYAHAAAKVATGAQGMGTVCVSTSATTPASGWEDLSALFASATGSANNVTITFHYHAKANDGYYFAGWSTTDGGSELGTIISPKNVTTSSKDPSAPNTDAPTYYAMFKPYVHVIQHDKMIRYVKDGVENINNAAIVVEAQASVQNISFALEGTNKGLFALVNPVTGQKGASLTVPAKQGLAEVELQYLGDFNEAIGKAVNIVVTAGSRTKTLTTTIENMPTLTFLSAQSSYTVKHTNGTGQTYTVAQNAANATNATITQITEESMLTVELALNQTTYGEYAFVGWQEISQDANGNEIVKYISYDQNCVYAFNGSAQVRPEFVHYSVATFFIKSNADKKIAYRDFDLIMHDAEEQYLLTGQSQVVVFESIYKIKGYTVPGTITKDGTLASGNYTIPKGVTLLVPGDDNYTVLLGDATADNVEGNSTFQLRRKLILDEATTVVVNGNICVYAPLSTTQGTNGRPNTYGQIHLEKNARIIANPGAGVYVFGYITGDPNNTSVEMKSGSIVYEAFQVADFRGGTAIAGMLDNDKKVFPVSQYYVQSVETRLIVEYGAVEKVCCPAEMTSVGELCANPYFVLPTPYSGNESAVFRLGEGSRFIKYYDIQTDRVKYIVEGGNAEFDNIVIDLGVSQMDSKDYVLPMSSGMDIECRKCTLHVKRDVAFLAGSTLYVDAQSSLEITNGASVFVYDKEQHYIVTSAISYREWPNSKTYLEAGAYNYVYINNVAVTTLSFRPNEGIQYNRKTKDFSSKTVSNKTVSIPLNSATWTIDGKVSGAIYTTNDGANITSNGEGVVVVNNTSSTKKTYQGLQHAVVVGISPWLGKSVTYKEIPITIAKLKNTSDYTQGANGKTYVYDKAQGKWIENGTSTPVVDNNDYTPEFTVTDLAKFEAYVGKAANKTATITTQNANVEWAKVDWSYQITGLSANQFTSSAVTTSGCTVTFAPTSAGSAKTATLKIIASYVKNQHQYTYSKEVTLTGVAAANANDLDFAISSIASTEKSLFVHGNGAAISIDNASDVASYVTLTPSSNNTSYTIQAKSGVNDAVTIQATQAPTGDVQSTTISKIITVGGGKQALPVTLNVTSSNFNEATWSKSAGVQFNNGVVMPAHSQWTVFFSGTPDKLKFTPTTTSTWQVEEFTGKGWNVIYAWETIAKDKEFVLQLTPSTSKIRIRSANGGTLSDVVITALEDSYVTANVDTLFIPMVTEGNTYSTSVLLSYMSKDLVTVSTSNASLLSLSHTVLDPAVDAYKQQSITLTSSVQEPGEYRMVVRVGSQERIIIPIIVYEVPQMLPIMLKSDADKYRYYYVTPVSQHATWNAKDRTITLKNEVGSSDPSLTFAFTGAPTYISFTPSAGYKGTWHVEQSTDANTWFDASEASEKHSANTIEFELEHAIQYVRVTYDSYYAETITIENLMIVGEPGVLVDPIEMEITKGTPESLTITAVNLSDAPNITLSDSRFSYEDVSTTGTVNANSVATIVKNVSYNGTEAIAYATLTITYQTGSVVVKLTGISTALSKQTGIYTGVDPSKYTIDGNFAEYEYHEVNIENAYVTEGGEEKTAFDYLIIYGETQPQTGSVITKVSSSTGSNAVTPCFIYKANSNRSGYELHKYEKNTNTAFKVLLGETDEIDVDGQLDIYMTGFCPYASTGYTKAFEGVWYFKGNAGETVNVYLEDCHIYSRNKTEDGHPFQSKSDGNSFTEDYVRGSGAVLVFACDEMSNEDNPFNVNIHTRGSNLLKSNHGCFYDILGYRAYQVSSPIQIRMLDKNHVLGSATVLTFDDIWPNTANRTNGYLALKKQVNNAPSIDMGNAKTVVNFRGGHVHLENAQIVSENYQTTLAICYRSGRMGGIEFPFAHGIGTDDVGGTVNFYDGTTTVEEMFVDVKYRQYYLMDDDGEHTSCLRCPTNTFIYGGSHGMIRACQHTTSKGGAPSDGTNDLGRFEYVLTSNDGVDNDTKLATINDFPNECLNTYYATAPGYEGNTYGLNSVTPINGKLIFWIPDICSDYNVTPEEDKNTLYWSACMTQISAEVNGQGGSVGGETFIDNNTEVQNLLYCKIDGEIYDAITDPSYTAPVKIPSTTNYQRIPITVEGYAEEEGVYQNFITNESDYEIKNKVYYVTTATADVWMTFTPPFDVEKIYVMETFSEEQLRKIQPIDEETKRQAVMKEQAKHNADFAAFYGVAMALYKNSSIDFWNDIFKDYITWAKQEDMVNTDANGRPLYTGGTYTLRDRYELVHYDGSNASTSHYYLYENEGNWTFSDEDDAHFETQWQIPDLTDGVLMNKGRVYSLLFPYCTGCWETEGEGDELNVLDRSYWDYWSGKFIIFESTDGSIEGSHIIRGTNYIDENKEDQQPWIFDGVTSGTDAILTGNSTFAMMNTLRENIYVYSPDPAMETFTLNDPSGDAAYIAPTTAFLYANVPVDPTSGMPAKKVTREGKIVYGEGNNGSDPNDGTTTGTHVPTVGGGNDMFITGINGGINIAVAAPQMVSVVNATGNVLYHGYVNDNVNVYLPMNGIYVIKGENEVQKIFF